MLSMPFQIFGIWLRGIFSIALIVGGIYCLRKWNDLRHVEPPRIVSASPSEPAVPDKESAAKQEEPGWRESVPEPSEEPGLWHPGWDRPTAYFFAGVALLFCSIGGGSLVYPRLFRRGGDDPRPDESTESIIGGAVVKIPRTDGSEIHTRCYGPPDAPAIVFTHGWGVNSAEWHYTKSELGNRYRLIFWDLPGLGKSTWPADKDWSLEKLAHDLDQVVGLAGERPVVLAGHSIGGMITLTYCRLYPGRLRSRIAGLALVHTTYTNPVKTARMAPLNIALQKPLMEPLCYLTIALAPLFWALNWLSYFNGSVHKSADGTSFSGRESWGQLDFAARFAPQAWPGVIARGMLAMLRYDASEVLARIPIPAIVIVGDLDTTTTPAAGAHMAQTIPNAKLHTLTPARHMGFFEHHDEFTHVMDQFVASCTGMAETAAPASSGVRNPG